MHEGTYIHNEEEEPTSHARDGPKIPGGSATKAASSANALRTLPPGLDITPDAREG